MMEEANKIASQQGELGQKISKLFTNLKKDSTVRKTEEYLQAKASILEEYWAEAENNNDMIIELKCPTHNYFKEKYFDQMKKIYETARTYIEEYRNKVRNEQNETTGSASMEMEIEEFRKLAEEISEEIALEKSKIRYKILQDKLNREWEILNEVRQEKAITRSSQKKIGELYDQVREDLLTKIEELERKGTQSWDTPLPQITIPHFYGKYEEWNTFSDLFQKMIHANTNLSNVQKMQHLKGHVRGEASKLIQHLYICEKNYETAWNVLKTRYQNERLLMTKLIDKLLDLPTIRQESAKELKQLHDTTIECLAAIKNLGINTDT